MLPAAASGCSATDDLEVNTIPMSNPNLGIVSVNSSSQNLIIWNKPVTIGIESYYIYRETSVSNEFEKIGEVPYDSLSVFVDKK